MTTPSNDQIADIDEDAELILVVDDDPAVLEFLVSALRDEGYVVLAALNGQDALTVAGEHAAPIHLVVSDINMPKMGGLTLMNTLRKWYPRIRFLLISGYIPGDTALQGLEDSPTAFLAKPFAVTELTAAVRELLDRRTTPRRTP
jgi:CheY-like chemotaxis protein